MNILVTGANGFVGKALCKRVALNGWQVWGTVRSAEQAAGLPTGVEVVQIKSIGADTDWSGALAGVDTVVHLAARVHVIKETVSNLISEFRRVNVAGTESLVRMAEKAGVRRFVFLSSIGVNSERMAEKAGVRRFVFLSSIGVNSDITHDQPFTEEDKPRPYNSYTLSKFEAEQVLLRIAS